MWNPSTLGFDVQLLGSGSEQKGRRGRNYATDIHENASGEAHEKLENMMNSRHRALTDTWVGSIVAAMRLEQPFAQRLFMPQAGAWFLITANDCPPQSGHNDFDHHRVKNRRNFVIVKTWEEFTIWVVPGSHNHMFYSDVDKRKLSKIIKMEEIRLSRESVIFGCGSVQHGNGE